MIDPNWARWIFASVSQFFKERCREVPLYVEGTDMAGRRKDEDYFEFRMNGPHVIEVSSQWYWLYFDVNILVCSLKDAKSFHRIQKNVGYASSMFAGSIPIYKYGNGPDDDQGILDCALLETDSGILINNYGQFDPTLPLLQSTVEGGYRLTLAL